MRARLSLVSLLYLLLPFDALAQEVYRLQASDRIEVWASLEPSLRRVVTIGPDGWLSLPLVGHVKAAGLTAPELEKTLLDRLKGYFREELDLTIMLQPAPERAQTFYVTGEVETPGSYPFRAGTLVLHGVAMAGGLYRGPEGATGGDPRTSLEGEVVRLEARLAALSAQIARITAEIEGTDLVLDGQSASEDLQREQNILEARKAEWTTRLEAREEVLVLRERVAESLRQQAESLAVRIAIAEDRRAGIAKLVSRGYVNATEQLEHDGNIASLQGSQRALEGSMAAAELAAAAEDAEFASDELARRSELMLELRDAQREQDTVRTSLAEAERQLRLAVDAPRDPREQGRRVVYSIVRIVDGVAQEFEASDLSSLEPGDLVRVGYAEAGAEAGTVPTSSLGRSAQQALRLE